MGKAKVFIVPYESQAKHKVYFCDYESQQKNYYENWFNSKKDFRIKFI